MRTSVGRKRARGRPLFSKVLIVNRGAIARRIVRTCNELGIASAAVYSDADKDAPHLAEAGQTVALPGVRAGETYLNRKALLAALAECGADAVHPGYGFLAESAGFADEVAAAGATFIGPSSKWLRRMGDKAAARRFVEKRGFPVLPGSEPLEELEEALAAAEALGYPVMVKPVGGGGGIGMCVAPTPQALAHRFGRAKLMAERAFADPRVYLERCLERPRHIEVQLLADGAGGAIHLYERECSIQRRHQKLVEECPAPALDRDRVNDLCTRAERLAAEIRYDNVGTLETLQDGAGQFGFLEMNTRIQVEHGVTEEATGVDLVRAQIEIAAGGALPARPPMAGHAVEVRVYAEDPVRHAPSTGRLSVFRSPRMHGVRIETGYAEGQVVGPYYDPLLAKVIGAGHTRELAIGRALVGLKGFEVVGVQTNIPALKTVLADEAFLAGRIDTGFLARPNTS